MTRTTPPPADHEYERLNPGAHTDPPQPRPKPEESRSKGDADLPGSQNADLRGAKRDRTLRGSTT
ncbi:MAG: hypothetical protein JSS04_19815 [Proteobacteria bacterium]|nr:hypothetical protein [Pseudomonadota bacterium]